MAFVSWCDSGFATCAAARFETSWSRSGSLSLSMSPTPVMIVDIPGAEGVADQVPGRKLVSLPHCGDALAGTARVRPLQPVHDAIRKHPHAKNAHALGTRNTN